MKNGAIILILALGVLLIAAFTQWRTIQSRKEIATRPVVGEITTPDVLPVHGDVAEFTLTNSLGKAFPSESLRGKVWAADMIFTTCPQMCEDMSQNMGKLYQQFITNEAFQAVSISVNPSYDTPEILHAYAKRHGADPERWHFLTGPLETIKEVSVNSLKIGTSEKPIDHSRYFVLVDSKLQLRGFYDGLDQQALDRLARDVKTLLAEK